MSEYTDITAAIIGTGFIGAVHADALRRLGVRVGGVLTRDPDAARDSGRYPRVYRDLDEMCADETVDVVHVTSPNHLHAAQVRALLAAGKHVVCEKPLALTAEDGQEMLRLAHVTGLIHAICFNIRFYPQVHQARAMLATGTLGAATVVSGSYLQDWLALPTDWNWRLDEEREGRLRAMADIGSHWLDLVQFVTDQQVVEVLAELRTVIPVRHRSAGPSETFTVHRLGDLPRLDTPVTGDDAAGVLLRLSGEALGVLTVSQVSPGRKNACGFEVAARGGSLAWQSEDPERLWIGRRGAPNELLLRDPDALAEADRWVTRHPAGHAEGFADTFHSLFAAVYADVLAGGPSSQPAYPTFVDGVRGLRVGEAVADSNAKGTWVTVERGTT